MAFHSLLRWKMIILPIFTTSLELCELRSERVNEHGVILWCWLQGCHEPSQKQAKSIGGWVGDRFALRGVVVVLLTLWRRRVQTILSRGGRVSLAHSVQRCAVQSQGKHPAVRQGHGDATQHSIAQLVREGSQLYKTNERDKWGRGGTGGVKWLWSW